MSKVSCLIGEVVDGTFQLNRIIKDEKFYTIQVSFRDTVIPVLFSEYVNKTEFELHSKLAIHGSLMSDVVDNQIPIYYYYANKFEIVDIDEETTNLLNFSCTVTKVKEFQSNNRGIDILPLVCADASPITDTSVFYLCTKKGDARRLKDIPKGYLIEGTGYLKQFRDIYEIYVTEVTNMDEILGTKK